MEVNRDELQSQLRSGSVVDHEILMNTESEGEETTPTGRALAVAKDASGAPIFGAEITWEHPRADDDAETLDRYQGSELNFIYGEGAEVPFRVTVGGVSEIVYLPVNAEELDNLFVGDAFADGCDARGDVSGSLLLSPPYGYDCGSA